MDTLWPWLAVAGAGALHGLNPATGWLLAAACGTRTAASAFAPRALAAIAVGHVVSIALVAGVVMLGANTDALMLAAGALLVVVGLRHWRGRTIATSRPRLPHAAVALGSFIASTAHGAGLMLVPALAPLCFGASPARALTLSGSMLAALAAVAVHGVAMLAVTGLVATAAANGWRLARGHRNAP